MFMKIELSSGYVGPKMLRPQDVLCVLKISCYKQEWVLRELGKAVGLSSGETYNAYSRLKQSQLVYEKAGEVKVASRRLLDFLVHGVPTVYYQERGQVVRGMATGSTASPLSFPLVEGDVRLVWPSPTGKSRGETLRPIYDSVPVAAASDPQLYELLVLVDCLRTGRSKERKVATELLAERLGATLSQASEA